jgi:hypothetical protein
MPQKSHRAYFLTGFHKRNGRRRRMKRRGIADKRCGDQRERNWTKKKKVMARNRRLPPNALGPKGVMLSHTNA